MRPISFLSREELKVWGNEEISSLADYYGKSRTVTWEDGAKQETSQPLIEPKHCLEEWSILKEVVLAEKYPCDSMKDLWHLIVKYHKQDFTNLVTLAQLALTSAVHTAGCERGFSAQNQILTKGRNRLLIENQHKLMLIKTCTDDIDYNEVISEWRCAKQRRIYKSS